MASISISRGQSGGWGGTVTVADGDGEAELEAALQVMERALAKRPPTTPRQRAPRDSDQPSKSAPRAKEPRSYASQPAKPQPPQPPPLTPNAATLFAMIPKCGMRHALFAQSGLTLDAFSSAIDELLAAHKINQSVEMALGDRYYWY